MSDTRRERFKQATHRAVLRVVQNQDDTYEIFFNGEHVRSRVASHWLEAEICGRYGFCGNELRVIVQQLQERREAEVSL